MHAILLKETTIKSRKKLNNEETTDCIGILLVTVVSFFPACEVENCPPNALAYAQFAFVDQYGRSVQYTDTLTVIGQLETADTTIYDTLINKSTNTSTLSLPLSYGEQTRFILTVCQPPARHPYNYPPQHSLLYQSGLRYHDVL